MKLIDKVKSAINNPGDWEMIGLLQDVADELGRIPGLESELADYSKTVQKLRKPKPKLVAIHPLYEIQDRFRALETDIIHGKVGSTEVLVSHLLTMTCLIRGMLAVAITELEMGDK